MATKVSVFNNDPEVKIKLKKIEFVRFVGTNGFGEGCLEPSAWGNVQLFKKGNKYDLYDLILAWNDNDPSDRMLYLGYWNDGVV